MQTGQPTMGEIIAALRPMMGSDNFGGDFIMPTTLRNVPSLTSPDTNYDRAMREYAELGGSAHRDR
jgi:hypothetical protein